MLVRKTVFALAAGTLLAASAPAFADHDRRWERGHRQGHVDRRVIVERPVYAPRVPRRVVVERPVYAERPVYVGRRAPVYAPPVYDNYPVYEPVYEPPVVYHPPVYDPAPRVNPVGTIAGAAIGAVIGNQVGDYHSRGATTAIGAVIGGLIGSQF